MSDAHIIVKDASLRFRIYRNPSPGLKETVVQNATRKNHNTCTEFDALKNINLELYSGDRLGIVGLNGAGKSTLLKMIVGIYPPHSGEIIVHGKVTPMIELGTGFDHELSGRENIYLNGALLGRSYKQMRALEADIIEFSELGDMIDLPIKYYSSGMHGRLAFSIGAICDPEILLMDEIFAAGDAQFIHKCLARLHQMMNKSQILVLVSHENDHILSLCNRAIALYKGQIVKVGEPQEVIDYYMDYIVHDEAHPASPKDEDAEEEIIEEVEPVPIQPVEPVYSAKQMAEVAAERDLAIAQWQERKPIWISYEKSIVGLEATIGFLQRDFDAVVIERDRAVQERDAVAAELDALKQQVGTDVPSVASETVPDANQNSAGEQSFAPPPVVEVASAT